MLLVFAAILMVGMSLRHRVLRQSLLPASVGARGRRLRLFVLAVALALVSIPGGAWAKAPSETSAPAGQTHSASTVPTAVRAPEAQTYASREMSAKGLEKFEGGDTTVIISGSLLVIVLIVVLIVVLI